jgi:hypothetical protein
VGIIGLATPAKAAPKRHLPESGRSSAGRCLAGAPTRCAIAAAIWWLSPSPHTLRTDAPLNSIVSAPKSRVLARRLFCGEDEGALIPGQKRFEIVGGGREGQVAQDIAQPKVGFQAVGLGSLDQRVDQGARVSAGWRIGKKPRFAAHDKWAYRVFGAVIVYGQIGAFEVSPQPRPLVVQIG